MEDGSAKSFGRRGADIDGLRKEIGGITIRLAAVTGEMNLVERMLGTTLAAVVTILFRVFSR